MTDEKPAEKITIERHQKTVEDMLRVRHEAGAVLVIAVFVDAGGVSVELDQQAASILPELIEYLKGVNNALSN